MATVKKPGSDIQGNDSVKERVAPTPESGGVVAKKRKRLAKVFKRPLDKTLRKVQQVHEKFSMPEDEIGQLLELKQRLADQGLPVKKSELVRAGLMWLTTLNDSDLKAMLAKIQANS